MLQSLLVERFKLAFHSEKKEQQVFALVERIRESGLTVLIVEQNVRQVLRVVDRAYLLEAGTIRSSGAAEALLADETIRHAYLGI